MSKLYLPPSNKRYWLYAALVRAIAVSVYIVFSRSSPEHPVTPTAPPAIAGWEDLVPCAEMTSLDETRTLELLDDQKAILRVKQSDSIARKTFEGRWEFDESSKRYAVTLNGTTTKYLIVSLSPGDADLCVLIAGDLAAADLRTSWFSSPSRVDDDRDH